MTPLIDSILADATLSAARRLASGQAVELVRPPGRPTVPPDPPLVIDLAFIRIVINFNL